MDSPPTPARSPPQLRRKPKMDRLSDVGANGSDSELFGPSSATSTSADHPFDRPPYPPTDSDATTTGAAVARDAASAVPDLAAPADVASSTAAAASANAFEANTLSTTKRNPPYLPTPTEALLLGIFPVVLTFGALFSVLSPQMRAATAAAVKSEGGYPAASVEGVDGVVGVDGNGGGVGVINAAHFPKAEAPSYFARKDNIINQFFVKQGWFWITLAFGLFVGTHPFYSSTASKSHNVLGRRLSAILRWGLVTLWWVLVTQWCFGPPLIDRSFRLTGGGCDEVPEVDSQRLVVTAAACRRTGGKWRGGHDISGHVFLLVLGSAFLLQEIGWVLVRERATKTTNSPRTIMMADGAVKSADVEADTTSAPGNSANTATAAAPLIASRFAGGVVALSLWMLLMTAIFFHTWREKITGLAVALTGLYGVYIVPRFVPVVRRYVGLPGL